MANRKGVFIGAYVPNHLKESLRRRAAAEHRTLSQEITRILKKPCTARACPRAVWIAAIAIQSRGDEAPIRHRAGVTSTSPTLPGQASRVKKKVSASREVRS